MRGIGRHYALRYTGCQYEARAFLRGERGEPFGPGSGARCVGGGKLRRERLGGDLTAAGAGVLGVGGVQCPPQMGDDFLVIVPCS